MIDTHAHLYVDDFREDIKEVIARAAAEGVTRVYLPAIDSGTLEAMLKLEADFAGICIAMMGLHPCSLKENWREELAVVEKQLFSRPFAAVGEIGLDYYWDKTYVAEQALAFHQQVEWALALDKPIVIHSRNSTSECIKIVAEHQKGGLKGIFHCFGDSVETARQIIDLGFYLGIGGVLTYKKSGLAGVLAEISLEHIVLETDAPYLTPVPFRGKRNESSYLKHIVARLAEVKGVTPEEVMAITTANAEKIFGT
jgi:TatD DNase family protein